MAMGPDCSAWEGSWRRVKGSETETRDEYLKIWQPLRTGGQGNKSPQQFGVSTVVSSRASLALRLPSEALLQSISSRSRQAGPRMCGHLCGMCGILYAQDGPGCLRGSCKMVGTMQFPARWWAPCNFAKRLRGQATPWNCAQACSSTARRASQSASKDSGDSGCRLHHPCTRDRRASTCRAERNYADGPLNRC